jgi:hypothetical protein
MLAKEVFRREMRARADTRRSKCRLTVFVGGNELLEAARRLARMRGQSFRRCGRDRHRRKLVERKIETPVHRRIDRQRRGRHQHRIAVRLSRADGARGKISAGAAAVLDHHRLTPGFVELLRHEARQRIGEAACGERDDEIDLLRRIFRLPGVSNIRARQHDNGSDNPACSTAYGFHDQPP